MMPTQKRQNRPYQVTATLILFTSMLWPGLTQANSDTWYAAIKASIGQVDITDIELTGVGTGNLIGGQVDGQLEDDEFDDYTAGLGVSIGRHIGNWIVEAEFVYRYRTDWDLVAPTPSIQTITNVFSNVETNSLLLNIGRRGVINQHWSWEAGVGAGLVYNSVEGDYIEREVPGISPEYVVSDKDSQTDFSYSVFAGVTRELGRSWTLNLRYRYIDLGDLEVGPFPTRTANASGDHQSGELQFSLERTF